MRTAERVTSVFGKEKTDRGDELPLAGEKDVGELSKPSAPAPDVNRFGVLDWGT